MPTAKSQLRPSLKQAVQQHAAAEASTQVAWQMERDTVTAAGSMDPEKDLVFCDASGGAFNYALPIISRAYVGKPYIIANIGGSNSVTLTTPGAELIDGGATLAVAAGATTTVVCRETSAGVRSWQSVYVA